MTDPLFIDFETASLVDLKTAGLDRYAKDPSTRPYCMSFRLPKMRAADYWEAGSALPAAVRRHVLDGRPVVAHNALFEYEIWNNQLTRRERDVPPLALSQLHCSAARARYNGLPGSLERAAKALGLPVQKDMEGAAAMRELMVHPEWTPQTHPELFSRVYTYALLDTDVMCALWHATAPLPEREREIWLDDAEINLIGIGVDVEAAAGMAEMVEVANEVINLDLSFVTAGELRASTELEKLLDFVRGAGTELSDSQRETVKRALAGELPPAVRAALELRAGASRAPKKHGPILRAHVGGRIRHHSIYHGALSGRTAAGGAGDLQALNVARPRSDRSAEDCERYLEAARARDFAFLSRPDVGPPLAALADAQRSLFRAEEGCLLVDADLSGIEARLTPWCANDESVLVEYEEGVDGYVVEASNALSIEASAVGPAERQLGKIIRLALGFGGGDGALSGMAEGYGLDLPEELRAKMVWSYREKHPAMATWWGAMEWAALIALDQPGRAVDVPIGRGYCSNLRFRADGRALRMELPSGRVISYHNARLQLDPGASAPIAVYDKPEGYVEKLERTILSNNVVQGLARDLFWEIVSDVRRAERVVHTIYDQLILEVPEGRAEKRLRQLLARMSKAPAYLPGLPLSADGHVSLRWRK